MDMEISTWIKFRQLFIACCFSKIEEYEDKQFAGNFWRILWRLKDDTVNLHKTAEMANEIISEFYRLDSFRSIIFLQSILIVYFLESYLFEQIFSNFEELVESNEIYVKYILYKNKLDSSFRWVLEHGDFIFQTRDEYLKEAQEIKKSLGNQARFQNFQENEAEEIARKYHNYFGVISEFANGLENYINHLFEGSKRDELQSDYIPIHRTDIDLPELLNQLESVNDLFKSRYFDVIPFKIRLILEFIVNRILTSKNPNKKANNFYQNIENLKNLYQGKKFLIKEDQDRLKELRKWGNLTSHDIFPAISKQELLDKQGIILRLINKLVNLSPNLFIV